jgi:hypothetical protein
MALPDNLRTSAFIRGLISFVVVATWLSPLARAEDKVPTVAVLTTVWHQNSHADVIAGRLLDGYSLDGQGEFPKLKLVSAYVDQFEPRPDKSRDYAKAHGFPIYGSIKEALTLGGDKLAVDGILMICEHGNYPESETGSIQHPKRKFFEEIVKVFEASGRVVPVFSDKHLEDDWTDIDAIYRSKQRLMVPMMAGSSLPGLWRYPAADTQRDKPLKEIVATSYHRLDAYGFHALEMAQCLAERRKNGEASGETGVKRVRTISGPAVWAAGEAGEFDLKLLDEVVTRFKDRPLPAGKTVRDVVKEPILFMIDYSDGLRTSILTMDGANVAFAAGWRYADGTTQSTDFWTQEARPFQHFAFLLKGVEQMIHTGKPAWPVERTLMTSGQLDALLVSHKKQGEWIETPHLAAIKYQSDWNWQMPPPPPTDRPLDGK